MYVAPPMRMGAWSMARVLRQRIEYYIYIYIHNTGINVRMFLPYHCVVAPHTYIHTVIQKVASALLG